MYFSDDKLEKRERIKTNIDRSVYNEVLNIIKKYNMYLKFEFPKYSYDSNVKVIDIDIPKFNNFIYSHIDYYSGPLKYIDHKSKNEWEEYFEKDIEDLIEKRNYAILDMIELIYEKINISEGIKKFKEDINRLFSRNHLIYNLNKKGKIELIMSEEEKSIINSIPYVEDEVEKLLNQSRDKILKPKLKDRQIAIEKLWDAFERLKTVVNPNKTKFIYDLFKDNPKEFIKLMDNEGKQLSGIGNGYRIRHHEENKIELNSEMLNYFYYRMASFISIVSKKINKNL